MHVSKRFQRLTTLAVFLILFGNILIQCAPASLSILQIAPVDTTQTNPQPQASAPPSAQTTPGEHLLLDLIDFISLDNIDANTMVSLSPVPHYTNTLSIPRWDQGFAATFIVQSKTISAEIAIVDSASYQFSSVLSATAMLDKLPRDDSVIDTILSQNLRNNNIDWRGWFESNDEGLPVYLFSLRYNQYIFSITVLTTYEQTKFANSILHKSVEKIISKINKENNRWSVYIPLSISHQINTNSPSHST